VAAPPVVFAEDEMLSPTEMPLAVPGGVVLQAVEPIKEEVPAAHFLHSESPVTSEYVLTLQLLHADSPNVEKEPVLQSVQTDAAVYSLVLPLSQLTQRAAPPVE